MKIRSNGGDIEEVIPFMGSFESTMKADKNNPDDLLISNAMNKLFSLNTKTKEVFEIEKHHGERIFDYISLPQNRVLMLTEDGYMIMKSIDGEKKNSRYLNMKKIKFRDMPGKSTEKMIYCQEENLVAVCINVYTRLSRILIFKVKKDKLELKSTFDFNNLDMNYLEAMSFHKTQGRFVTFSGLSNYKKSTLFTFVMDKSNYKLLLQKKFVTDAHHPSDLHLVEDKIMGVDERGVKFEISL